MSSAKVTGKQLQEITNPCEMPSYGIRDAAHYLQLPPSTLKSWVCGRRYPTQSGPQFFEPVINLPDPAVHLLSFFNLVEAHVLSGFRRQYHVRLKQIRSAMEYVEKRFGSQHPLIEQEFETDGISLFVEKAGLLVDASAQGQMVMDLVRQFFKRVDREESRVVRLWPFTRSRLEESPKTVFIDPRVSFGRPSLAGCHVPTVVIAERYKAGESIDALAEDYGCDRLDIEEGLRCELDTELAA